jgi:23S rRNA (cytosine1962-C5)-methyltransferase
MSEDAGTLRSGGGAGKKRLPRLARYQLRKEAVGVVLRDAPWIFRDHLSSAAEVFEDGQWLRLVDGKNKVLGYGIYEAKGAVAIRVLRRGEAAPDGAWLRGQVDAALAKRESLRGATDAFRALHGESDGVPAVVIDVFGKALVVQSYSRGAEAMARAAARMVAQRLGAAASEIQIIEKPVQRRQGTPSESPAAARWLRGAPKAGDGREASDAPAPRPLEFQENGVAFVCDPFGGQKSGAYLDLRGLRRAVAAMPLTGTRVLNLFAYTGMLGRAAELSGAQEIWQVDVSAAALETAAYHHVTDAARHQLITADVFEWLPAQPAGEGFGLVIVDPPSMTSRRAQVPAALAAYRKLYRAAAAQVAPGGTLVAACCTSRITRAELRKVVTAALGEGFEAIGELPAEADHPVRFTEADYLKILIFKRRS